jgi:chaperonin GroEL
MIEEIAFSKEGRDKLLSGINKANKAVSATMGPNGKTVIISDKDKYGSYKVTKDGVSVINSIKFKNPIENIGVQLLREAANRTVDQAGDGTTTSTVLATAFINNLKDFETKDINKAFDEIIPKVIEQLKLNSRELKNEDIKYVASISANNDMEIGNIIQSAYDHTNIVKVEESKNLKDTLELVNGMSLPVSFFSKHFINNNKKGSCEFSDNVFVLLLDTKLEKLENFQLQLELAQQSNTSLLIITEDVHESALMKLESLVLSHNLPVCVIKTPGFSKHRKDLIQDLSKFTGATIITDVNKRYTNNVLGKLDSCTITKHNSILVKHEDNDVKDLIDNLFEQTKVNELEQYEIDLLNQRIQYLNGKVSIIKVGGNSELEMKERKDRYDDAVLAVACALEEGIVEGGGIALNKVYFNLNDDKNQEIIIAKLLCSLAKPYSTIFPKAIIDINELGEVICFDLSINMFEQNIIDPLKVTRCALENAVSVAKVILSTEAVVLNELEWNQN